MIIQAELKCKQTGCEADPCAVDKVIELPSLRFQQFSRALLADYDFIAENKNAIRHDEDARHCLLILDAEGTDGFLIDPQGYNYARYSAFVPNARSLLTPDMAIDRSYISPAEPWRDESRDEMLRMTLRVNGKPDYTLVLPADEEYLDAVKNYLDIDKRISDLSSQNQTLVFLKQQGLVDPDIFIAKTNELTKQLRQAKLEKEKLMDAESDMTALQTRDLIDLLDGGPEFLDSFDAELFGELVEKIIIESNDSVRFCLKNGLELRESIERTVR